MSQTMPGFIQHFEPRVLIEIDDVFTGTRKIARVTESGQAYNDLDDVGSTPSPLYEELRPVEVGNILGWGLLLVDQYPQEYAAFKVLVDRLINSGAGVLTYNRAAYWAFCHHCFDYDAALTAGRTATELVRSARRDMDAIIANARRATVPHVKGRLLH